MNEIKEYWNLRAKEIGDSLYTTSNDPHLKIIELKCLNRYLPKSGKTLEVGCGNGYNLRNVHRPNMQFVGLDISEEMIKLARLNDKRNKYIVGDVLSMKFKEEFECIFTNRCLINIVDPLLQIKAIENIHWALKKEGKFILLEQSIEQVERINKIRGKLHIPPIIPPKYNLYIRWNNISGIINELFHIEKIGNPSSIYYFTSRIINAFFKGNDARYGDILNKISVKLPQIGNWGTLILIIMNKK